MGADQMRTHARAIWDAAVNAVRPDDLVRRAVVAPGDLSSALTTARRIIVVGGGKAGAAMAVGLEEGLKDRLDRVTGLVNVPAGTERPLRAVRLNIARPAGSNQPTAAGVYGTEQMLALADGAGPDDVLICLLSGGGSALLPCPPQDVPLEDKQAVTRLLHECGATIGEMNTVRKHLSRFKGGGLVRASKAGRFIGLIISDVVGDPLDVIGSGPTAPDPTTFADALEVIRRYHLVEQIPAAVRRQLERGAAGDLPETLKQLPAIVSNVILGNNALALSAAQAAATALGYRVLNMGANVEGETQQVAATVIDKARGIAADGESLARPACILVGGETTVTLGPDHGKGGRNTEFVLAALIDMDRVGLTNVVVLSGGTDGEDGPTDAAGAIADSSTLKRASAGGLEVAGFFRRHDSYSFFSATGDLLKTGLTGTNVMDVRLVLLG